MYDVLRGRAVEDVQDWLLEHIQEWIDNGSRSGASPEELDHLDMAYAKIEDSLMLSKEEAKVVEKYLLQDMHDTLNNNYRDFNSLGFMDIDTLGIYSDAWGLYCRPGTHL